jgi:hypothetical protein
MPVPVAVAVLVVASVLPPHTLPDGQANAAGAEEATAYVPLRSGTTEVLIFVAVSRSRHPPAVLLQISEADMVLVEHALRVAVAPVGSTMVGPVAASAHQPCPVSARELSGSVP